MEETIIKTILEETKVDITILNRKRQTIELRSLYFTVLKELKPHKTLHQLGNELNLDHATVIHSLKMYKVYEKFNKDLKYLKSKIIYNFTGVEIKTDKEQDKLQKEIYKLKFENIALQNRLEERKQTYNIIDKLTDLLEETKGTEQHIMLIERLEAYYKMNNKIKL